MATSGRTIAPIINAKEWTGGKIPANAVRLKKTPARRAISSVDELVKGYKTTQVEYDQDNDVVKGSEDTYIYLSKGTNDDEIVLGGFIWGYDVTAKVDVANGKFSIPHQSVFTSNTYGGISLTLFFYYSGDTTNPEGWYYSTTDDVEGKINDDGTLEIEDYYALTIDTYEAPNGNTYNDVQYSYLYQPSVLNPTNGAMIRLTTQNARQYYAVEIAKNSNVVSITNFAGYGETVDVVLGDNNTLTIDKQLVWQGGSSYGDFYTYAADYSVTGATAWSDYIGGDVISGTYTDDQLYWENWLLYSDKGYAVASYAALVVYTDGSKFSGADGISTIKAEKTDGAIYGLDGRRLNEVPTSGLYIQNGKKYIAK